MLERQVFVLRVWRDPHGELRASLKSGTDDHVTYFQNLELIEGFLKTRFREPEPLPGSSQSEARRKT